MVTQIFDWFHGAWQVADKLVGLEAKQKGISKEEAWAGVSAATQIQGDQAAELMADLLDPLGWRAVAVAFNQAA